MEPTIQYLMKIGKREYLESTCRKGQFFMNTCEYFRNEATKEYGNLVGDIQECSFPQGTTFNIQGLEFSPFDLNDPESSAMCCGANYCIYCTYAVFASQTQQEAVISESVFRGIIGHEDPSQYGILIFKKPYLTIRKIVDALSKRGLIGRCDLVQYDDHIFASAYQFGTSDYILDLSFHKRRAFKDQNEYRITTINVQNHKIDDLYVGALGEDEYAIIPVIMNRNLYIETGLPQISFSFRWGTPLN